MSSVLYALAPVAEIGGVNERLVAFASTEGTTSGLLLCASVVLLVGTALLVLRRQRRDPE